MSFNKPPNTDSSYQGPLATKWNPLLNKLSPIIRPAMRSYEITQSQAEFLLAFARSGIGGKPIIRSFGLSDFPSRPEVKPNG